MVPLRAAATLSAEEIRDVNTRYHDVAADHYDSKWGIDFGELGREQVLAKVRKALGRAPGRYARSLEIGAGTGYFTLNMLRAGVIGEATCSDISPGMLSVLQANARRVGLEVQHRARRRRAPALRRRELRPRVRPRRAPPHPRPPARVRRVRARARARRHAAVRRRALPLRRPPGRACPSGSRAPSRRCGVARSARAAAPAPRRRRARRGARRASSTSTPSPPPSSPAWPRGAASRTCACSGEELLANWFGWTNRTLEATRRAERRAVGLAPVRLPRLPAPAGARPPAARVAAAGGDLLQPDDHRAQAPAR